MASARVPGNLPTRARELTADLADADVARRAGIGVLEGVQAVLGVVFALPRLVVRALGVARALSERVEDAGELGDDLRERARLLARAVESPRADRRRRRVRSAGLVAAGFGAGVAVGWLLADRRARAVREHDRAQARAHADMVRATDLEGRDAEHDDRDGEAVRPRLAPVEPQPEDGRSAR
jgi:hypothetical protein